ncbi:HD domain-containing protein [Brucepastera parasyntrophica]|uniref:HD domain-containing protein n=1 Tax=Brucepastera parasyntrophica TaxID=2880008 RepID=UPI002108FEF6|nr:HD domain-containing protein [Brucepastera parasyntrophica]ULQ58580.1 HD domain-containing protein [Brucepastera parasyntrophica]
MTEKLINELCLLVETACKSENNIYGYGIWTHHIKPMIPLGLELAEEYGADKEIVTVAILLHDLAAIEDEKNSKAHHRIGAEMAEKILSSHNYPPEKREKVKACILNHRSSVNNEKTSIEEICVADADAIIHLKECPSLFYSAYREMGMTIGEGKKWVREKLLRDYRKLSERSREKYRTEFEVLTGLLNSVQ